MSGNELDPLCQQEDSPVGREQLPIPGLHKLFRCQAVKSGTDLSLSFILADYNENAVKLDWFPVSPSHCWHLFYKELHLGVATSV